MYATSLASRAPQGADLPTPSSRRLSRPRPDGAAAPGLKLVRQENAPPAERPASRVGIPDPEDGAAWERFHRRYRKRFPLWAKKALKRFAWLFVAEDLEDIQQEVYCRLVVVAGHRRSDFRGSTEEELMAFLYRMTVHVVMDRVRKAYSVKRGGKVRRPGAGDASPPPRASRVAQAKQEVRLLAEEACKSAVEEGLRFSPAYRQRNLRILRLALVEGFTGREIAQALGGTISPSTVDSTLFRLRRRMQQVEPAREVLRLCA
jgi:RNA polymerase sigma factor (sigma-70 family)